MAGWAKLAARWRVPSGFVVAVLFAWGARPRAASLVLGLPLALGGLLLRGWAAGHVAKNQRLATSGPFAYTRNPLYIGTLTVAAGFALAAWNAWLAAAFAAYFLLVYLPVIGEEESHLRKIFPDYAAYAARVPRLWPSFAGGLPAGRFEWERYRRNQEYQALAGFLAGAAVLAVKMWW